MSDSPMDSSEIEAHWDAQAKRHGSDLAATTKTGTIKRLEIDALHRALQESGVAGRPGARVLEVGCGNGANCIALAERCPGVAFTGVDFIAGMVEQAEVLRVGSEAADRLDFHQGDILALDGLAALAPTYDAVFTDRCVINLNTIEKQKAGLAALAARVAPGGVLLLIENSVQTHAAQNVCREALGLPARRPAAFNLFLDETVILPFLDEHLERGRIEDFASLHDLMLYVLGPALGDGTVDYESPLVEQATRLSEVTAATDPGAFGSLGQNRLYVYRRPEAGADA